MLRRTKVARFRMVFGERAQEDRRPDEARDVALGSGGPLIKEAGSDGCGEIDVDEASQPPRAESPRRQPYCSLLARQGIPFCESHPCG